MSVLHIQFDHGLGDCSAFAHLLQLYRRREYSFAIESDANKDLVWKAAGAAAASDAPLSRHEWNHPPHFNRPDASNQISSSKIGWNINLPPLPNIGDPEDLWRELCAVNLEAAMVPFIGLEEHRDAFAFLKYLPRPIVLLHTAGTTSPETKSLPSASATELYRLLLGGFEGSLVLLDWDNRVPKLAHARVRHTETDWSHISLAQLAALMEESALLIGVDSGPYYFASLNRIPALGVFHHHYPACLTLPRTNNLNMTRAAYRTINISRRTAWNIVEYASHMPTAEEIACQAFRMLAGPRYGLPLGRDVMMQQWIRDWCSTSTPAFPVQDRDQTLDFLFREMTKRFAGPTIVETGCVRATEDWRAGYSTYLFGAYLDGLGSGRLISLDNSAANCRFAELQTEAWSKRTMVVCTDSVAWLANAGEQIDVLYLDSLDTDFPGHADHSLRETQAAESKLSHNAIVVYDDSPWNGGWAGKGAKAIPYLLERDWHVVAAGYQTLLSRC
jgi:predicted O-methyltransferase YrrM